MDQVRMTPIRTGMTVTQDGERYRRVVVAIQKHAELIGDVSCKGCAMYRPYGCNLAAFNTAPCSAATKGKAVYYHYERVIA